MGVLILLAIPVMINILAMGIPSLLIGAYAGTEVYAWGVAVGLGELVSTSLGVVTATAIIVAALTPLAASEVASQRV